MLGKCFALEGLECSGKTTLFNYLKEKYEKTNVAFIPEAAMHFFNKYETNVNGNIELEVGFMTFNAIAFSKAYNCINKGYNVIFDRSWLCQLVYSQARENINIDYNFNVEYIIYQENLLKYYFPAIFNNTIVVYLDLPIETIIKRKLNSINRHPNQQNFNKEWLEKVHTIYENRLSKVHKDGIKIEMMNSNKPMEEVFLDFDKIFRKYALIIKPAKSKVICIFENEELL
ncbi:MAG: deoxynucleoside kinase [Candidatus Lokiarchaeota archaeon]|nr:deoxynucleoside kinase [Candidatus Lokiarchaeota archaeon]